MVRYELLKAGKSDLVGAAPIDGVDMGDGDKYRELAADIRFDGLMIGCLMYFVIGVWVKEAGSSECLFFGQLVSGRVGLTLYLLVVTRELSNGLCNCVPAICVHWWLENKSYSVTVFPTAAGVAGIGRLCDMKDIIDCWVGQEPR